MGGLVSAGVVEVRSEGEECEGGGLGRWIVEGTRLV